MLKEGVVDYTRAHTLKHGNDWKPQEAIQDAYTSKHKRRDPFNKTLIQQNWAKLETIVTSFGIVTDWS